MRRRIEPGTDIYGGKPHDLKVQFAIPPGPYWMRLREELKTLTYSLVGRKTKLLNKDDWAIVLGHSPDIADALIQSFAFPWMETPHGQEAAEIQVQALPAQEGRYRQRAAVGAVDEEGEEKVTVYAKDAIYETNFAIGETVYHKLETWDNRTAGMIVCIHIRDSGTGAYIEYGVVWGNRDERSAAEFELTRGEDAN